MKTIWITFQKEGIHCYPEAKDLEVVAFLQYPHKHMFHFKVEMEVLHANHEVEFITLKRELEKVYGENTLSLNSMSCEMIATNLVSYLEYK